MTLVFCKYCKRSITWTEQKSSYGKLIHTGYDIETVKKILPAHFKCAQKHIKNNVISKNQIVK